MRINGEWCGYQRDIAEWSYNTRREKLNPRTEFDRVTQEVAELGDEVVLFDGSHHSSLRVAGEAADVIIGMLGIGSAVGINMSELVAQKIEQMNTLKYPPAVIQKRMDQGETREGAMKISKDSWSTRANKRLMGNPNI